MINLIKVYAEQEDYFGKMETTESIDYWPYEERAIQAVDKMQRRARFGFSDTIHLVYDREGKADVLFIENGKLMIRRYVAFNSREEDAETTFKKVRKIIKSHYED